MSKKTSGTKESTDTEEPTIEAASGGFEVRSDPAEDVELEIEPIPSTEGGVVKIRVKQSREVSGCVFLTADEAAAFAAAIEDAETTIREYGN